MATKKITFDPEAGVAYPCDLIMNVGADFSATFNVVDTSNTGFTPEELQYKEYTFTANELPSFKTFRIKFLMTSTNQAFVPRLTSLKVIATA